MSDPVLYHGEPNGPSLSVLAALHESALDIECRNINLLAAERHILPGVEEGIARDMAVEGEGPVLLIDGEAMSEAVFLAQYFDERVGGCGLQPDDPYEHWQMMMWCRQATERLAPACAYLGAFAHAQARLVAMEHRRFAEMMTAVRSEDLKTRWQELRSGKADEAKIADSKEKVAQFADRIEGQLADGREWLTGRFSIADLETFSWLRSMRSLEAEAFAGRDRCLAWMDRVEARESVQWALAQAATEDPENRFAPGPEINRWG
jgi:glutathione S-transferase